MPRIVLFLGGVRCGKSALARRVALQDGRAVTFVGTADAADEEMARRIERHRRDRPTSWTTLESPPRETALVLRSVEGVILLDCLTVWLARRMSEHPVEVGEEGWEEIERSLLDAVRELFEAPPASSSLLVVSNEVGSGVVPAFVSGRRFRDLQGRANQLAASMAESVALVVAGIPLWIKGSET